MRRYLGEYKSGGSDMVMATTRAKARYEFAQRLMNHRPGINLIEAERDMVSVRLAPGEAKRRGPKPGTPNAYFERYPGELSTKSQQERGISPGEARMDPNRGKRS